MNEKSPCESDYLNLYSQRQKVSQNSATFPFLPIPTPAASLGTLIPQLSVLLSVILCSKNETVIFSVSGAHEGQKAHDSAVKNINSA